MHRVVALVLPQVVAFDLAVPAQVFGHPDERDRYSFDTCTPVPGLVPSTTGFAVSVSRAPEALSAADTIVVPGYVPHSEPAPEVLEALRMAAATGTRIVSVCTGAFRWPQRGCWTAGGRPRTGETPPSWPAATPRCALTPTCSTSPTSRS